MSNTITNSSNNGWSNPSILTTHSRILFTRVVQIVYLIIVILPWYTLHPCYGREQWDDDFENLLFTVGTTFPVGDFKSSPYSTFWPFEICTEIRGRVTTPLYLTTPNRGELTLLILTFLRILFPRILPVWALPTLQTILVHPWHYWLK